MLAGTVGNADSPAASIRKPLISSRSNLGTLESL
jgi:hypothetical protein